jgi:hypothetical protein
MTSNKQGSNQGGNNQNDTSNRGFASMDPEKQREIAAEGGRAAHASGNAHEFTSEEAREAGAMSHKNDGNNQDEGGGGQQSGTRGGSPEQHAKAGSQSHKNDGNQQNGERGSGETRGGSSEQHARAGSQSHKNDDKR